MARNKFPEETERKILEVSFRLFQEKGYEIGRASCRERV